MASPEPLALSREAVNLIRDIVGGGEARWVFYWHTPGGVRRCQASTDEGEDTYEEANFFGVVEVTTK